MKHWQKKELFHVKHRVLLRTLSPFNARLNHRRKAAGFILRMFQLHVGDQAGLPPCSGSSFLNRQKRARMRNRFLIQADASSESQRSAPI